MSGWNQPPDQVRVHRAKDPVIVGPAGPCARKFRDYALLAACVYADPPPALRALLAAAGWSLHPTEGLRHPRSGLVYEVWMRRSGPTTPEIALVFRGTDDVPDWISNLRWVSRWLWPPPDQYDFVRASVVGVVERLAQAHPGAAFVSVGHSLGGGLAQQAAYMHPAIRVVYAFDSSPVTGERSVPQPQRGHNAEGMKIYRVFEHGEILAYARLLIRSLFPLRRRDPEVVEVRFNLRGQAGYRVRPLGDRVRSLLPPLFPFLRDSIDQHSMSDLAEGMDAQAGGAVGAPICD